MAMLSKLATFTLCVLCAFNEDIKKNTIGKCSKHMNSLGINFLKKMIAFCIIMILSKCEESHGGAEKLMENRKIPKIKISVNQVTNVLDLEIS